MLSVPTQGHGARGPMEEFARLFGSLLAFVHHCFDLIVIRGHLLLLTRPENIVHFFRDCTPSARSPKRSCGSVLPSTTNGSRLSPAITTFPSNGPSRGYAKKITCVPAYARWNAASATAFISFSKAWRSAPTSGWQPPNIP